MLRQASATATLLTLACALARESTLYEVLGLRRGASTKEIRSAYHRLALELHPDKSSGDDPERTERFIRVSEAYSVLSDPEKRRSYDSGLPRGRQRSGGGGGGRGFSGGGGGGGGDGGFQFTFSLHDAHEMMRRFKTEHPEVHDAASRLAGFVEDNLYLVPGAAAAAAVLSQQSQVLFSSGVDGVDWDKLGDTAKNMANGAKRALSREDGTLHWGRVAAVGAATSAAVASALDALDDGNRTSSMLGMGKQALRAVSGWFGSARTVATDSSDGKKASARRPRARRSRTSRDEL